MTKAVQRTTTVSPIASLPFVRGGPELLGKPARDFWHVPNGSGRWEVDYKLGQHFAGECLGIMREMGSGVALTLAVQGMVERGSVGPTETGFLDFFGSTAAAS